MAEIHRLKFLSVVILVLGFVGRCRFGWAGAATGRHHPLDRRSGYTGIFIAR